jgi:hypothetical protein
MNTLSIVFRTRVDAYVPILNKLRLRLIFLASKMLCFEAIPLLIFLKLPNFEGLSAFS